MELQVLRPLVCDHSQAVLARETDREGLGPRTLAPLACDHSLKARVRAMRALLQPWEAGLTHEEPREPGHLYAEAWRVGQSLQ